MNPNIVIERVDGEPQTFETPADYPPAGTAFYVSCQYPEEIWVIAGIAWMQMGDRKLPYLYGISEQQGAEQGIEKLMGFYIEYVRHMGSKTAYAYADNVDHRLLERYGFTIVSSDLACREVV